MKIKIEATMDFKELAELVELLLNIEYKYMLDKDVELFSKKFKNNFKWNYIDINKSKGE